MSDPDDQARRLYEDHAKRCAPEDFWGQVKRTIGGKPVDAAQIELIIDAIHGGLALAQSDILLDLCCGNGALTDMVFNRCAGGTGVDVSPHLVDIANKYFARPPERIYRLDEVVAFASEAPDASRFTKALCYGSFKYFSDETAHQLLKMLRLRFPKIERFFIGNNVDKARREEFFYSKADTANTNGHNTFTGLWRTEDEFTDLAVQSGWNAQFQRMPKEFYAAHYCFDVVLLPRPSGGD